MSFLTFITLVTVFLAAVLIIGIILIILGALGYVVFSTGLWFIFGIGFLIVVFMEMIMALTLKYELIDRKEQKQIERQRKT